MRSSAHRAAFPLAILVPLFSLDRSPAQAPAEPAAAGKVPSIEVLSEYAGFADPRVTLEGAEGLRTADAAIAKESWKEAASVLDHLLGPPVKLLPGAARVDREGDSHFTSDGILYTSLPSEVRRRVERLPPAGLAAWRECRGDAGDADLRAPIPSPSAAPAAAGEPDDWLGVLGRPDHAALEIPERAQWAGGGYTMWVHRLTNERELLSSQPPRNFYYAYFPMQLVSARGLVIGRSHQDLVAIDRTTGVVRWRVDSDVPLPDQTIHQRGSVYSSWHYFSDIGGWALTVIPGEPERVVVTSISARPRVSGGKMTLLRNELRAYDTATGALSWHRGGMSDSDPGLEGLTFASPPVRSGPAGDILVAPAMTPDAYFAVGLTPGGDLLWTKKLYTFEPSTLEIVDESLAFGASLASNGAIVAGAPGHGLIFALTADGETLWEARYPSAIRKSVNDPRWAPGHPVISAGKVIAAPFDGDCIVALDALTGAAAWTKRFPSGYFCLLGADRERVYWNNVEGRVSAASIADGSVAWTSEALGPPAGRGFAATGRLYVPVERAIAVLDTRRGTLLKRWKTWDERLEAPSPGNLFLSGGNLFLAAPHGFACMETLEATRKGLGALGLREGHLRGARLAWVEEKYEEALDGLRTVLHSTSDDAARDQIRSDLLQVAQEAAAGMKDMRFIQRVLDEPDLIPTRALRTAFVLRSAELLEKEAPGEVARMYREILSEPGTSDLVVSPEGTLVDVALYASDVLRVLVRSGSIAPQAAEEERVSAAIEAAAAAKDEELLSAIALRSSHASTAAGAHAHLARMAEARGDTAAALSHVERLLGDYPSFARSAEVRDFAAELRAKDGRSRMKNRAASAVILDVDVPWERRFFGKAEGSEIVSTTEGSDPLPGMLAARNGSLVLVDSNGKVLWKADIGGPMDLKDVRGRLQSVLVEPLVAHARAGSILVFSSMGIHEVLPGRDPEPPQSRAWLALTHPLLKYAAGAPTGGGPQRTTAAVRAVARATAGTTPAPAPAPAPSGPITIAEASNFFARVLFDESGDPYVVEENGRLTVFERRTGRIRFRSEDAGLPSAGPSSVHGGLCAVESAAPPGVVIHDLRARGQTFIATPVPPWGCIVLSGIGVVIDSPAGIQVRSLERASGPDGTGEGVTSRTLWRDLKPRGFPALAFADVSQVVAVKEAGKLSGRAVRSGRVLWSVSFPEGASPAAVFRLEEPDGAPGDYIIAASRDLDPTRGRGVLGQKIAQDLVVLRVSRDGHKRWETQLAEGPVAFDGAKLAARPGLWILAFNHKAKEWRTRAVALDLESGSVRDLFGLDLEPKPSYPPPRLLHAQNGLAVGNFGTWALFAPAPPASTAELPASEAPR
ncbi:MAG TPA: PQQ-binding-like beta-propeller repeat protein [Planctomycetota bacterium]|nr:PQQ-binding-like beta-propeller repeat protein [Planctomycetota bacterium]